MLITIYQLVVMFLVIKKLTPIYGNVYGVL